MHKELKKPIVYALSFIAAILLLPFVVIIYQQIYGDRFDPIEKAVAEALGDEDLKLGAKLQVWIDYLGMPDRAVKYDNKRMQRTELYWLKKGFGVGIDDYEEPPISASALDKEVDLLIIPFRKNLPPEFMQYRRIEWPDYEPSSALVFETLLDVKLDIDANYDYFDASDNYYYNSPFPFHTRTANFYYGTKNCYIWTCAGDVNLALVYTSKLSVNSYPIMLLALPYIMLRFTMDIFDEKPR